MDMKVLQVQEADRLNEGGIAMRKLLAGVILLPLFLYAPVSAAECTASDFNVENFEIGVEDCRGRNCPMLVITGELVNNCSSPAGARLEIEALNSSGRTVESVDGWPAQTSNVPPGESVSFDFTGMMGYDRSMADFSVFISEVRVW